MRIHLPTLLLMVASSLIFGSYRADAAERAAATVKKPPSALETQADSFVSIVRGPTGRPILAVTYPWREHTKASIEIRELPSDEVNAWEIKPLYFRHAVMKGEALVSVSRCLDQASEERAQAEFTESDIDFEVLADRNVIASPSVCVACRTEYKSTGGKTAARAIYPMLEPWSADRRTLYLDLPKEYFPQACSARIWMLHGNRVIWTTIVEWPGAPNGQTQVAGE